MSRARAGERPLLLVAVAVTLVVAALLVLPLAALVLRVPFASLVTRLAQPEVLEALRLSVVTSLCATALALLLGVPVAWLLATRRFRGQRALETLLDLPLVLPPTVAGLALLLAFGRMGLAGQVLSGFGVALPFTTAAVVLAQVFMALPFTIGPVRAGFAAVDARLPEVARTLGASEWRVLARVLLPLAAPSIATGAAMAFARSLGEFGATLTFAGNLPGVTQTMPLAVYVAMQTDLEAAVALSLLLVLISFALLLALRALDPSRRSRHARG